MNTIDQAIIATAECLESAGIDHARMESEFLVAAYLGIPRTHLLLRRAQPFSLKDIHALRRWVRERQKRKPLAYLTGTQPFRDLWLKVGPEVLVPRPETELLVEQASRVLDRFPHPVTAADVGTGCGNITLSLLQHLRLKSVYAIDASQKALAIARENERRCPRGARVTWVHGDLLDPLIRKGLRVELIVANLPYVRTSELRSLDPELHWEPRQALDGGPDGLRWIVPCIRQAEQTLVPGGVLLLEIGMDQSSATLRELTEARGWSETAVFSDWAGLPRIVQARRKRP